MNLFDGVSPINGQNRALLAAWIAENERLRISICRSTGATAIGIRCWKTPCQMAEDGVRHALAFVTSPVRFLLRMPAVSRRGSNAHGRSSEPRRPADRQTPTVLQSSGLHRVDWPIGLEALVGFPPETPRRRPMDFHRTQHSPRRWQARCPLRIRQLREACRLVMEQAERKKPLAVSPKNSPLPLGEEAISAAGNAFDWKLAFQSRSGPPPQPWLEPDIRDAIQNLHAANKVEDIVIVPIGFLAENIEVPL